VIAGFTVSAAHALGRAARAGSLEVGKPADFFSIEQNWSELFYSGAMDFASHVHVNGRSVRLR
jgi:imidazolonepropionase-like amidohydrolase